MSSARPAPAASRRAPRRPARLAALREPMLRVRWDRAGRVALLVVLTAVVGIYAQRTIAYLAASSQASRDQAVLSALQRQNAHLAALQRSLDQPATIVEDARQLGMVRPGEQPYVILGPSGH